MNYNLKQLGSKEVASIDPIETHMSNIASFKKILKYFLLSKDTYNKVIKAVDNTAKTEEALYIQNLLKLDNNTQRVWYELKMTSDLDIGYSGFCDFLSQKVYDFFCRCSPSEFCTAMSEIFKADIRNVDELYSYIIKYENYVNNTIEIGNQKRKLFKFLVYAQIINREEMVILTQTKTKKTLYFCISRNPIDFLFCSTDQSFSSCQDTRYALCGLGSLILDPNRFIVFITDGKLKKFELNAWFSHYRYIQRSWGLLWNNNSIVMIRNYPIQKIRFKLILNNIGFQVTDLSEEKEELRIRGTSKFAFEMPTYFNNAPNFIYLDYIGLSLVEPPTKVIYDGVTGYTGHVASNMAGVTFTDMDICASNASFYLKKIGDTWICSKCKSLLNIGNHKGHYTLIENTGKHSVVCCKCITDNKITIVTCYICGLHTDKNSVFYIKNVVGFDQATELPICCNCNKEVFICVKCNRTFYNKAENMIQNNICAYCFYAENANFEEEEEDIESKITYSKSIILRGEGSEGSAIPQTSRIRRYEF